MNEQILSWLRAAGMPELEPEYLGPNEGAMGLFCQGRDVLWERRDILGNRICRQKLSFRLALRSRETHTLDRVLALEPMLRQSAPVLGEDRRVLVEKGRTVRDNGCAVPVREINITVEYTTKEEN